MGAEMLEEDFGGGAGRALRRKSHSWDSVLVSGGNKKNARGAGAAAWLLARSSCPGASFTPASALGIVHWLLLVLLLCGAGKEQIPNPSLGVLGGEIPVLPLSLSLKSCDLVPWLVFHGLTLCNSLFHHGF